MAFFKPASRKKVRGRIAFDGPAGSGKTFTALRLAHCLGSKIAVINTESGAVEKYLGLAPDGIPFAFDVCELPNHDPTTYTQMILEAARCGYEVLVIDSFSHSWAGTGGALELVDKKAANSRSKNNFSAWKDVTPMMHRMVDAILGSPCHIIATMRTKMEYILEEYTRDNGSTGTRPVKVGMAPIQRQGVEYEFDVVGDLDNTHTLTITKSRCPDIDGQVVVKPGAPFFDPLVRWLNEGSDVDPSHYVATEDDLRRSELARRSREAEDKRIERQQDALAKAAEKAEQPKVDAKELMRRKAAERAAAEQAEQESEASQDDATPGNNGSAAVAAAADGEANIPDANSEAVAAGPECGSDESGEDQPPFSNGSDSADSIDAIVARIEKYGPLSFGDKWGEIRSATLKRRGVGRFKSLARDALEEICEKVMAPAMGLEQANADVKARQSGN